MPEDKQHDLKPGEVLYPPGTHPHDPIQDWAFRRKEVQEKGEIPASIPVAEFGVSSVRSTKRVSRRTPEPDKAGTPPVWKRPGKFAEQTPAERREREWERYPIRLMDGEEPVIVEGRIYDVATDRTVNIYTPLSEEARRWLGRAGNCSLIKVGGEDKETGGRADAYVVKRHPAEGEILEPRKYRANVGGELKTFDLISFRWIDIQADPKATS